MRLNFQQKLVVSFLVIFALFAAGIVIFEQQRARRYKTDALKERLDAYADEVLQYALLNGADASMDSLLLLMPPDLRLTIVERGGRVIYDNVFAEPASMDDHSGRPEIVDAVEKGSGTFIRVSASNNLPYLYYAKDSGNSLVVRAALPYDIRVQSFLKPDNAFLYFVIALFLAGIVFIYYVSRYFGSSVQQLRDFSVALNDSAARIPTPEFPNNEFGEIAGRLVADFNRIRDNERQLAREREKLLLHIQTSAEGVCFFNPDRTVAFYNGLFMQYLGTLAGEAGSAGDKILDDENFRPVVDFLDDAGRDSYYEARLGSHGKEFFLRINIFEDKSFEMILTDITAKEKDRRLKQEMTGNIAHELRTPVTSIRGFLEIVLNNELGSEKRREYLERAYAQAKTLSEQIADMTLLTRIDERRDAFEFSQVDVNALLEKIRSETSAALSAKSISFNVNIPSAMSIRGNEGLLYSVFRNMTDNVIRHAGEGIDIYIRGFKAPDGALCFSFADTGKGINDERHLNRLFDRFYRVDEGRTRDTGGSGLGLSIVRNAVRLHGGSIVARNGKNGGLEFIIRFPE